MTDNTQTEALLPSRETLMAQAQVFASAWAIAGSRFDPGDGMEVAEQEKAILADMTRRLHARIAELEEHIEAIGAGGVNGPLMGKPQEMPYWMQYDERTDVLTIHGKRYAAGMFGEDGFLSPPGTWLRVCVGSEDCVTLTRAPIAANAGREPVAFLVCTEEGDPDMVFLSRHEAQQYLEDDERPTPLYTHPSPSEGMVGGWISVDKRLPEPNVEVLCAGQGWGKPFVTACYYDDGRREWYPINTYWTDSTGSAQYPTHWMPLPSPPTTSAGSKGV